MCKKLVLLVTVAMVLSLVGSTSAQLPAGWQSQDVGTPAPGSADESGGVWTVTGNGNDIWGTSDNFHYAYVPLIGDGEITARVVDNGTGSNSWSKGGVMIRETLEGNSKHAFAALTGGDGNGICYQSRGDTGSGSVSFHGDITASPPHWVKLVREGDMITGYHSDDGVDWELFTDGSPDGAMANPRELSMPEQVYIGLAVSSHAAGELRTWQFDNVTVGLPVIAYGPSPGNGEIYTETWASLSWNAGHTAVSHDVYFGENAADVEAGTGDTFQGNVPDTFFIVGFVGNPYPDGLVNGTTYYWRIDEVEADGTKHTGKVWSFTIPPKTAYDPVPSDGAKFIPADSILSWTPGFGAKLHNVYFGDNFEDVNSATGAPPHPTTTFNPGPLEFDKTYYWRIDEVEFPITHRGEVWSFTTTLPGLGTAVMDRWENIATTDINTLKDNPKYPNNPDVTETVNEFLWDGADLSDYGARIEGWLYVPDTGDYTFWLACDDQGELWLSNNDDSSNAQMIAYVKDPPPATGGWTNLNEWTKYASQKSEPVALVAGEKYYIMAIWKESGGGDHCHVAWEGPGIPDRTTIPGSNLSPFEPVSAFGAKPSNNATGVTQTPVLQWKPGLQATSHEVYFGTDQAAVANATKASPEYKGDRALGEESFEPGKLPWESTFYWRIDEVNALNPDSPWIGSVWSFTTADFLIVDDFEDYDVDKPIWEYWLDGIGFGAPGTPDFFGGNGTGAAVGDENSPSYMEENIVHGGRKSLVVSF
ncbi:MAG: PA14 domain-containing protein, partial [Planctomycetota bacterium]